MLPSVWADRPRQQRESSSAIKVLTSRGSERLVLGARERISIGFTVLARDRFFDRPSPCPVSRSRFAWPATTAELDDAIGETTVTSAQGIARTPSGSARGAYVCAATAQRGRTQYGQRTPMRTALSLALPAASNRDEPIAPRTPYQTGTGMRWCRSARAYRVRWPFWSLAHT